ncbi:MotA/TolQ/ExbB proton channel family protein [Cerasicoccus arenae]|uniref:Biopolymer transporter ExbB n=1 Tax=Cerasicoccus arenae TaxID=424488 RepID=A0A8J3GEC0_9BACT|nr:MotA/TolQ/ExbB proton channel family protein [Cerasicoccus arenae]MBK1858257.1 MotA/TolQ/ExbB proton channel family protein [Cerasicoccus arenae]GHC02215.1 biopolymer transporter ExbB [Cerasicoccus arenae]
MEGVTFEKIIEVWSSGGTVMYPLFFLACLLYVQAFQLMLYVRRSSLQKRNEFLWGEWVLFPERAKGRVAEIIRYTQTDISSAKQIRNRFDEVRMALLNLVDRRVRFINTLVATAPLLGLLGTVIGMLQTFLGLATSAGGETAGVVASGISEALLTTLTGLIIALPGLFIVMIIQRQKHSLEANIMRLECLTLSELKID